MLQSALPPQLRRFWNVRTLVILFFIVLFAVGVLGYERYGVSWDEPNMFNVGEHVFSYLFYGTQWTTEQALRFYGTVFELPLAMGVHALGLEDSRDIMLFRHFWTFMLFIVGVFFFYLLARRHFKSERVGLLGAVMLVISPRIFADAFYNSKDIPNLVFFIIAMYTFVRFLDRPSRTRIVLHAFASALAVGLRLTASIIPALTVAFVIGHALLSWKKDRRFPVADLINIAMYAVLTTIFTIAVWPFLWQNPVGHFLESYKFMSSVGVDAFYMGEVVHHLPWHYIFVWIAISTPLLYTLFFLVGLPATVMHLVRSPAVWNAHRARQLLFLCWFFVPIIAIYATGSGIDDGWRHVYFLYPAFLLLSLEGVRAAAVFIKRWARNELLFLRGFIAVFLLSMLSTSVWMVWHHGIENMYFAVASSYVGQYFERDYWGLTYRPLMEYLLAHDPSPVIHVYATGSPGFYTNLIMKPADRARLDFGDMDASDYFFDNYRWSHYQKEYSYPAVYRLYVDGLLVNGLYKFQKQ